jgi:exopolyphosphatase / guanosine-5'-triphosphate,3'-diphosphate pyrophosphatase
VAQPDRVALVIGEHDVGEGVGALRRIRAPSPAGHPEHRRKCTVQGVAEERVHEAGRIGVVDVGTNSTRLLVAEVEQGAPHELERRSIVTRLGEGVDETGRLSDDAMARVAEALGGYREVIDRLGASKVVAVATSAMRDAENGPAFREELLERFDIDARTISGDEEARLTFLGATAGREVAQPTVVIDIGGGSTEYVTGEAGGDPDFYVSARMGSGRHSERFLRSDPPTAEEVAALSADVERIISEEVAEDVRTRTEHAIAVAGTATTLAAIDQELDRYDPEKVHGYRLELASCDRLVEKLAALPLDERRRVPGLEPARAPTIVGGAVILAESIRAFGLDGVEISEADILHGAALAAAESGYAAGEES